MIGYDSFSELPGIYLGTSWTVRSAMLGTYKFVPYLEGEESRTVATSTIRVVDSVDNRRARVHGNGAYDSKRCEAASAAGNERVL